MARYRALEFLRKLRRSVRFGETDAPKTSCAHHRQLRCSAGCLLKGRGGETAANSRADYPCRNKKI